MVIATTPIFFLWGYGAIFTSERQMTRISFPVCYSSIAGEMVIFLASLLLMGS